jgi:hypothetical protein
MTSWSDWVTAQAWRRALLVLICVAPLIAGVASRITRERPWFSDYDAIACAGRNIASGQAIYDQRPDCAGMHAVGYVYHPWVAEAHAGATGLLGEDVVRWTYAALYIAAVLALAWIAFLGSGVPGGVWDRLPALGLVTGSTIYWGNIALLLHAAIALAALVAVRRPLVFALVLAAAATVKPLFLTYGLVLLVVPIPVWRRLALGALAAGLGMAPMLAFQISGGELQKQWAANVEHFVYAVQPGDGFMGWLAVLGGDPGSLAAQAGWMAFAGLVSLAVVVLAERGGLSPQHRVWLAIGAGVLANPRIVPIDMMLLACLLGALVQAARTLPLTDSARRWAVRIAVGAVLVGAVGNSADAGDYAPKLATLGLFGCLVWLSLQALRRRDPERA